MCAARQRPALTVDVVIFSIALDRHELNTLLIRRGNAPYEGCWAIPGGFVHYGESLDDAARRELLEETGVRDVYLEQLYTFGQPDRDPRGHTVTVAYFALIPADSVELSAGSDAAEAAWHSVYGPPKLAFDHAYILQYALQRLRYKLEYTAAGFRLLPAEFTLTDLQTAYEIVLGEKLDKRNFRRRLVDAEVIEKTNRRRQGGEGRPAMLYRYREDADPEVKARRLFP
ncbi:MAG: NUDIX domain-containing protein [Anaerolineales bacterium]